VPPTAYNVPEPSSHGMMNGCCKENPATIKGTLVAEFIKQSIEHSCCTITLARPELHNAFNEIVIEELTENWESDGWAIPAFLASSA